MDQEEAIVQNFSQGDIHLAFWSIVEIAVLREGAFKRFPDFGSETNTAKYGGVEFWRDKNGSWCYSIPTNKWDHKKVYEDLIYWF